MIKSDAFQAQTTSGELLPNRTGRRYIALQNHDVANPVVVTLGGEDAELSPPNGMKVGPGEFGELNGDLEGPVTIISGTGAVDCTIFKDK